MLHLVLRHLHAGKPCSSACNNVVVNSAATLLLPIPEAAAAVAAVAAALLLLEELTLLLPALLLDDPALPSTAGRWPCCLSLQAYVTSSSARSAHGRKLGPTVAAMSAGMTGKC
jgi:hypothetical protein